MEDFICPNCKLPVNIGDLVSSGLNIRDVHGTHHFFHPKCFTTDVYTGWSGGPVGSGQTIQSVLKANFGMIGIELGDV